MSLVLLAAALAALLPAASPETAAPAAREAVVVASIENMYSGPSDGTDVVSQALLGQTVGVLEAWGDFLRVRTPDAYEGWLPARSVLPYASAAAPRYARQGRVVEVTSLVANVYREADVTTARPSRVAPLATRLEVKADGPSERWLALRLPDGATGWIQRGDVKPVDPAAAPKRGTPEEIVATARRFLGVPYLWGGMSAHGLDCSGFVGQVYRAAGVVLPRDADLQFEDPTAAPVERDALQPGDLVFFGRDAKHVSHVGLSLGGARFLNATTWQVPVVREDTLDDPHWSSIYQGARRPR
ncbi:MAG: C40 family peptidase [Vicinamibacteria bacterium]